MGLPEGPSGHELPRGPDPTPPLQVPTGPCSDQGAWHSPCSHCSCTAHRGKEPGLQPWCG